MWKKNVQRRAAALLALLTAASAVWAGGNKLTYGFQNQKAYKYSTVLTMSAPEGVSEPAGVRRVSSTISIGFSLTANELPSMQDLDVMVAIDRVSAAISNSDGSSRSFAFDEMTGKSVRVAMNRLGGPRAVLSADSANTRRASQTLGIDFFSKDVLNRLLVCLELPDSSVEGDAPWRYSRSDTVTRGRGRVAVMRTTECRVDGDEAVDGRLCKKIAFSVITHLQSVDGAGGAGGSTKGQTTATGALYLSAEGIPVRSKAEMKTEMSTGGAGVMRQSGKIETTLQ